MFDEYSTYTAADFLKSDFFVESMLRPTLKSESFWKSLIDNNKINVDEFLSAYMILKELHRSKPEIDDQRVEELWERIAETNLAKKHKKKQFYRFRYISVACALVSIIVASPFFIRKYFLQQQETAGLDISYEKIIHAQQPVNQIQLISDEKTIALEGEEAKIEYNENGDVKVNKESVDIDNAVKNSKEQNIVFNQLRVPYGKRAFLTLSDGTSLWVNTGTTVIYPSVFQDGKREIFVSGEVYAEVSHDANRPFIVKTSRLDLQVLGTVFNISAYEEDKHTDVVLVSGSVKVEPKNGKATLMSPNQLFVHTEDANVLKSVDVEAYISWRNGIYIFYNEPIENILLRISRYYNVTIKLPTTASGISCSGKMELKDELDQVMNGLCEISSMTYAVKNQVYQVKF